MDDAGSPPAERTWWTEADFADLGWHDATVHAVALEPEEHAPGRLLVDLDHIVAWVPPTGPEAPFTFRVAPATLVFPDAWDVRLDIDLQARAFVLQLDAITREPGPFGRSTWTLDGHEFTITVTSEGFHQYLRRPPLRTTSQSLSVAERGGISFDERAYDP